MELSVDISTNDDWCSDWDNIGFLAEDLFGLSGANSTFSQSPLISASGRGLQVSNWAICLSKLEC